MNSEVTHSFNQAAASYDSWYDQEPLLFQTEIAALRKITDQSGVSLEIGVGSGRFAQALNIQFGVDPSAELLKMARDRGTNVGQGQGENLPFRNNSFSSVFIIFTLSFTEEPLQVLRECRRILWPGGSLTIMCINASSPWGRLYQTKKQEGHPLYKYAQFFNPGDLENLLLSASFRIARKMSTLRQRPGMPFILEDPQDGICAEAGVVLLKGVK